MAREMNEQNSKNQPTHKVTVETEFGNLTISLFTKNNQFHAELAKALENKDISNFIKNKMTSAMLTKISDVLEINNNTVSLFEEANKAA